MKRDHILFVNISGDLSDSTHVVVDVLDFVNL